MSKVTAVSADNAGKARRILQAEAMFLAIVPNAVLDHFATSVTNCK